MRLLVYSLLAYVFIATAGLGWLFDKAYEQSHEPSRNMDKVYVLETLGKQFAATLNNMTDRQLFIEQWQQAKAQYENGSEERFHISLVSADKLPMPTPLYKQMKQKLPLLLESSNHLTWHYYLANFDEVLLIKAPRQHFIQAEQSRAYFFTVVFYLVLLCLFILWVYPLIKQLLTLRRTAKMFGEGELQRRVKPSSFSYIRDIENEFNRMAERIEGLVADVKLLSSAVSHDLRTPLAKIRFGIDTLEEETDPVIRDKYQQKLSKHVDDMTELVETLLTFARLDQNSVSLSRKLFDITVLVDAQVQSGLLDEIEFECEQYNGDFHLFADKKYLMMLLTNVVQNAIKYGEGKVLIQLEADDKYIHLSIHDNGAGVIPSQRKEILKPFVRGDNKSSSIKGHGIGLAMVKRIVDWHQGVLSVSDSSILGGACFTIKLPKK
ncbi:sensor histidine kinase [Thalassotalea atypica]|uniref:sensor histidine kinase n=1 Tax=Thalassotalea atypica TaxID=2054316 RepID=UPI002573BD72|nr:ATP-binding protein [Thalassotalea atypica]